MGYYLKLYGVALITFCVIDALWLGLIARKFYQDQLGFLLSPHPNWYAAIAFYALFIVGILVFVVLPGLRADSLKTTLTLAALFGLITYATYDLTNLALAKDFPTILAVTLVSTLIFVGVTCTMDVLRAALGAGGGGGGGERGTSSQRNKKERKGGEKGGEGC